MTFAIRSLFVSMVLAVSGAVPALAQGDPEAGENVFRRCAACHATQLGQHRVGPSLAGVFGAEAGTAEGFRYSDALKASGIVWDEEALDQYLANPRVFIPGNRMAFPGLRGEQDRADVIEYLKTLE